MMLAIVPSIYYEYIGASILDYPHVGLCAKLDPRALASGTSGFIIISRVVGQ